MFSSVDPDCKPGLFQPCVPKASPAAVQRSLETCPPKGAEQSTLMDPPTKKAFFDIDHMGSPWSFNSAACDFEFSNDVEC